ncbi:50S ribosomal protein L28 [Fusobacterium perfoetens]|uniref:50S ribosomal protein L28 n=1 Tax=Fusobacterium perfoetens TaxID=852 RepID=UPI0015A14B5D|nr:50S ribosomal protein L28 [Fusobacterium perfoetens]MCF2625712.1 50S ribosomal protein L28 [Fusobacterium perfoetens]
MQRCEISGKGITFGNQISHSHRLTGRVWKPNLQPVTVVINGQTLKIKVCTKVLKTIKGASETELMQILKANANTLSPRITKALSK